MKSVTATGVGMAIAIAVAVVVPGCRNPASRQSVIARYEATLDGAIPVGTSRAALEAWLQKQSIAFSYFSSKHDQFDLWMMYLEAEQADEANYSGCILARISDTNRDLLADWDTIIIFALGADSCVLQRKVTQLGRGL